MKKIVVLDGQAVMEQDFDFTALQTFGTVTVYRTTTPDKVVERIGDAEIVVTNKVYITKEILDQCPNVRFITVLATGYNNIDIAYAKEKGIIVCNVPAYSTDSVVQHTFALLLEIACKISEHDRLVKEDAWSNHTNFCLCQGGTFELTGKTLGIIGYGSIGKKVATIAKSFGMNVLYTKKTPDNQSVSLEKVLQSSDIISLHCPLDSSNIKMINKSRISLMKDGVILLNTARGGLIDEEDVAEALTCGKIRYFGADVLAKEPPEKVNPLIHCKNTVITSHIAWATKEALTRLMKVTIDNVSAYLKGKPINVVNQ